MCWEAAVSNPSLCPSPVRSMASVWEDGVCNLELERPAAFLGCHLKPRPELHESLAALSVISHRAATQNTQAISVFVHWAGINDSACSSFPQHCAFSLFLFFLKQLVFMHFGLMSLLWRHISTAAYCHWFLFFLPYLYNSLMQIASVWEELSISALHLSVLERLLPLLAPANNKWKEKKLKMESTLQLLWRAFIMEVYCCHGDDKLTSLSLHCLRSSTHHFVRHSSADFSSFFLSRCSPYTALSKWSFYESWLKKKVKRGIISSGLYSKTLETDGLALCT